MGSIYKRGNVWWIAYYAHGRQFHESAKTAVKDDAKRLLRKKEGDVDRGLPVGALVQRLTFEEAAADVVNDYKANGRHTTAKVQRLITKHLSPYFHDRRLANISTLEVRAYIAQRQAAKAKNATINRELAVLKRAFSLAHEAGKVGFKPKIPKLQEHNVRTGFFEREQFEKVRARLTAPLQAVVTFAYITGWRVNAEVLTLEWRQVDFEAGTVSLDVGATKNDEARVFPFVEDPELSALLVAQHERTKAVERQRGIICRHVFHRSGKPIKDYYVAWKSACRKAGSPGRIPHDFRRTAVRNLVRAGVPEQVAMKLTGHKTAEVFRRYCITNLADLKGAVKQLAGTRAITEQLQSAQNGE